MRPVALWSGRITVRSAFDLLIAASWILAEIFWSDAIVLPAVYLAASGVKTAVVELADRRRIGRACSHVSWHEIIAPIVETGTALRHAVERNTGKQCGSDEGY